MVVSTVHGKEHTIMTHSLSCFYIHVVFSTKGRKNQITPELQDRLWQYLGGVARQKQLEVAAVGGTENHVHLLLRMQPTMSVSQAVQHIKGNSSKWIHETFPERADFAWQEGYGAFSVGVSGLQKTIAYIKNQTQHHRTRTFEEEYLEFLRRNQVEYDERYVFG